MHVQLMRITYVCTCTVIRINFVPKVFVLEIVVQQYLHHTFAVYSKKNPVKIFITLRILTTKFSRIRVLSCQPQRVSSQVSCILIHL